MREKLLKNTAVVAVLATVCTFLWGSAFPCIKLGYKLFSVSGDDTSSQILFAGVRFTLAGLLVIIIQSIMAGRIILPARTSLPKIMKLSLFQTILQYFFFYAGLARTPGVKASIINGSGTFFTILLASLIFRHEKLTAKKVAGCFLGFAGVVLVNLNGGGFDMNMSFMGEGFILLCALAYAISSSLIKTYSKSEDPVMLSGYQFLFGGVVLSVIGFTLGGRLGAGSVQAFLMLGYLAFISAFAYSLWGILLKYNPISKVAIFGFMNPVFGVILSAWWLNESSNFNYKIIIALILVCAGIFCVNIGKKDSNISEK